jgi:hypothetical protein
MEAYRLLHIMFFSGKDNKRKYSLKNIICPPMNQRGLSIEVLDIKNKYLLNK